MTAIFPSTGVEHIVATFNSADGNQWLDSQAEMDENVTAANVLLPT